MWKSVKHRAHCHRELQKLVQDYYFLVWAVDYGQKAEFWLSEALLLPGARHASLTGIFILLKASSTFIGLH